jgi:hypothetical protein
MRFEAAVFLGYALKMWNLYNSKQYWINLYLN